MITDPSNLIRAIRNAAVDRGISVVATCAKQDGVELEWDWPTEPTCSLSEWTIEQGNAILSRIAALPAGRSSASKIDKILRGEG